MSAIEFMETWDMWYRAISTGLTFGLITWLLFPLAETIYNKLKKGY